MVALAIYQTWVITPALERQALQRAVDDEPGGQAVAASQSRLLRLNFWIGLIIVGLTAIARTA
jgi:hypothetical protein